MLIQTLSRLRTVCAGGVGSGPNAPCPQCGPKGGKEHKLEPGDIIKTKASLTLWNRKTGNNDTIPAGTKAKIINILPRVGQADQMVSVSVHKKYDPEYMKMNDVSLHKPGSKEQVGELKPVSKTKVVTAFKTSDGADVTWVKPSTEKEQEPQTLEKISQEESRFKGRFQMMDKVPGADGNTTRIYDSSNIPGFAWHKEGGSAAAKAGATVWVHRYENKVVIQEQQYSRWSTKTRGIMSFSYNNIGKAFGMLKQRYGISVPLKRERF